MPVNATRSVRVQSDDEGTYVGVVEPDGTYQRVDGVVKVNFSQENEVYRGVRGDEQIVSSRPGVLDVVVLASAAFQFDETQVNVTVQGEADVEAAYDEGVREAVKFAIESLRQSYLDKSDVVAILERYVREHKA